jgi:hypothetical protein
MTQPQETRSGRPAELAIERPRGVHVRDEESEHAVGWIVFAAIALALLGLINGIYGTAAIVSADFYAKGTHFVVGDVKTFGWLLMLTGVVQCAASVGLLAFAQWARWAGVATAVANGMVQMLAMPAAPFLMLALLTVDVLVVYGLVAYGQRWRAP